MRFSNGSDTAAPGHPVGRERAGQALERIRTELIATGRRLRSVLADDETDLVGEGLRLLDAQVCRIVVIGQIKAGKSSFINALVERHNLLPTDVNPWTTSVTSLNFGRPVGKTAAAFHFFSAREWESLAVSVGRLGELTERYVPGFERELLKKHVAAVKGRAQRRLGPRFAELLGQTHSFDSVSTDLLRRYVCAGGPPAPGQATSDSGMYADVTRAAEINLAGGPFGFPTSVIDTPGTNDPLLIRDEITRGCLDQADIYLVVLTARQPLGPSDLALLRILRSLHKQQIVVFINRIDEIAGGRGERDAVVESVRRRLDREFPGAGIPVIAGSAAWALSALGAEAAGPPADNLAFIAAAGQIGREAAQKLPQGTERTRALGSAMLQASGIPAIHGVLDALLTQCRSTHVIRQLLASFGEIARVTRDGSQADLASISQDLRTSLETAERSGHELQRLRAEMARLDEVVAVIEKSAHDFRQQLSEIVTHQTNELHGRLIGNVDRFSISQADALLQALQHDSDLRRWSCDTDLLRTTLAEEFVTGYREAELRIDDLHEKVQIQLDRLLAILTGKHLQGDGPTYQQQRAQAPRMTALSNRLVLDLRLPWWRAWWAARPTPEDRGAELAELIRSDLFPLVDELIDSGLGELDARVDAISKWTFGVSTSIVSSLRTQHQRLLSHYEGIRLGIDGTSDPDSIAAKRSFVAQTQSRARITDEAVRKITDLTAVLQTVVQ